MASASPDHVRAIYQKYGREFDADRSRLGWNDRHWHERFASLLSPGASVLDLGCGPGEPVARNLVQRGLRVTGVDSAPAMIALCRERMTDQEWLVGDMREVSLGRKFDGILGWDSYFFLAHDDQRRMFDVFAAHAGPSCLLMFNTGVRHGEAFGNYRGEPLYHASLDTAEYRALLEAAGFEVIEHAVEDPRAGGRTVWLARRK
jgi:SAM-dependent methyltransferase